MLDWLEAYLAFRKIQVEQKRTEKSSGEEGGGRNAFPFVFEWEN